MGQTCSFHVALQHNKEDYRYYVKPFNSDDGGCVASHYAPYMEHQKYTEHSNQVMMDFLQHLFGGMMLMIITINPSFIGQMVMACVMMMILHLGIIVVILYGTDQRMGNKMLL